MLGRLVAKMIFKVCVSLLTLAGVMSFGLYLTGGNPVGLWKTVAGGAFDQVGELLIDARGSAADLASGLGTSVASAHSIVGGDNARVGRGSSTEFFVWQDEQGVTHYDTAAPAGISADTITVDPNVNVVAPVSSDYTDRSAKENLREKNTSNAGMPTSFSSDSPSRSQLINLIR